MDTTQPESSEVFNACVCMRLARAARSTTRRYDQALRGLGLTSGQFGVLVALLRPEPVRLGPLAKQLGQDRTTLTRNLRPLEEAGLIRTEADPEDARARAITLTEAGRAKVAAGTPLWQRVQQDTTARLARPAGTAPPGTASWAELSRALDVLS